MKEYKIPFYIPWITKEDKDTIQEALSSRWLTGGPKTKEFEELFAKYIGVKHAIAVNSCTAALHLSMRSLDIKSGDEVILPVFTYAATANAPIYCGAKPVFVDIDENTLNISMDKIQDNITSKTKAIIIVHNTGLPCNMKEINEIVEDNNIYLIEDCAHSLGSKYEGKKTGSFGITGCFSFYPTKVITTLEGGMITTNNEEISRKLNILRSQGITKSALQRETNYEWDYDVIDLGYSYRLNEIQSSLGISQLNRINKGLKLRTNIAKYYNTNLITEKIQLPSTPLNMIHSFHLYVIQIKDSIRARDITRDELFKRLSDAGIQTSVHFTPLHLLTYYKQFVNEDQKFPMAEKAYKKVLSLPIYPTMKLKELDYVIQNIIDILY